MSDGINELATSTPAWIASTAAGITAIGYGVMKAVRQLSVNRRENAADAGATSSYTLLIAENKRLAEQLTALSVAVNTSLTEKIDLLRRMGEMERQLRSMADLEKENQALQGELAEIREENAMIRKENHDLRDKVQELEFRVSRLS